jgi:hypothetical protein
MAMVLHSGRYCKRHRLRTLFLFLSSPYVPHAARRRKVKDEPAEEFGLDWNRSFRGRTCDVPHSKSNHLSFPLAHAKCHYVQGLNWGGSVYPWKSAHVLCTLLIGIATLVGFCVWEAFCGLDFPLIPMRLFRNTKYVSIVACASIGAVSGHATSATMLELTNVS